MRKRFSEISFPKTVQPRLYNVLEQKRGNEPRKYDGQIQHDLKKTARRQLFVYDIRDHIAYGQAHDGAYKVHYNAVRNISPRARRDSREYELEIIEQMRGGEKHVLAPYAVVAHKSHSRRVKIRVDPENRPLYEKQRQKTYAEKRYRKRCG